MPRPGVGNPGGSGGKKGRSGRNANSSKAEVLKGILLEAVLEDCQTTPSRKLFWAERLANKLLPQTVEGTGDKGEVVIKLIQFAGD